MMSRRSFLFHSIFFIALFASITGCDRKWSGDITGRVTEVVSTNPDETTLDVDVIPIPDALVTAESMKNGYMISTKTDSEGYYRISGARWGPNRVFAYHPWHDTVTKYADVIKDKSVTIDFEMARKRDQVEPEITVVVSNPNGDPIDAARVDFYELTDDYFENWYFRGEEVTNLEGRAVFRANLLYENDIRFYQMRIFATGYDDLIHEFTLAWWNPDPEIRVQMEFTQ